MTNAYIFTKNGDGTSGLVHTFNTQPEAWAWVRTQDIKDKIVIVAEGEQDIMLAWRLFGANRSDDDTKRIQKTEGPDAGGASGGDQQRDTGDRQGPYKPDGDGAM